MVLSRKSVSLACLGLVQARAVSRFFVLDGFNASMCGALFKQAPPESRAENVKVSRTRNDHSVDIIIN